MSISLIAIVNCHKMDSFSDKLSEVFHFVDFVGDAASDRSEDTRTPCPDLNKTIRAEEFDASDESAFEKACARQNDGFVSLASFTPVQEPTKEPLKLPDYGRLLADELQQLRVCGEMVRKGEMPLTNKLKRKFATACIRISPNSSSSSSSGIGGHNFLLEMSQEAKDLLDAELEDPTNNNSLAA